MIEKEKLRIIEDKLKTIEEYEQFRGYPNYQTWCVANWLKNDRMKLNMVQLWINKGKCDIYWLGDKIKDYIENSNPIASCGDLYSQILDFSLAKVEYYYIAGNLLQEYQ